MSKILLTGGSGFIAAHVLESLLQRGHTVVTTVRSKEKGNKILEAHPNVPKDTLSYVIVKDIAQEGAFDKAVISDPPFDAVIHTASPFYLGVKEDPHKEFLDPAIKGTTGVLYAIKKFAPSVKRVAVTSSFAAIVNPSNHPKTYDENSWNPITEEEAVIPANTYRASKTFAERAAWDFVEKEKPNFTLTVLNPPLVLGPIIHYLNSLDAINTSNQRVRDLVQGKYKDDLPASGVYLWIDVRDLADAHVLAIELEEAQGHRYFVTAGYFSNKQIADVIREQFPELEGQLPSKDVKDDLPADIYGYDNSKTAKVLGIKFKSLQDSIKDTVVSIKEVGGL